MTEFATSNSPEESHDALGTFIDTVVRSGLCTRPQLTEALSTLPHESWSADTLAQALIAAGQLSRFQCDKLLAGISQGLLIEPYRLLCPVGRGGMGIVYLARDDRVRPGKSRFRLIALKLLPPKRAQEEPRKLTRFQHEMKIGKQLPVHPLIVRYLDSGSLNGISYIAMEYVPGLSARQLALEPGGMSAPRAARIFADVATALQVVHDAGYVHRDVKPSNIIVNEQGRGRILDFGFAMRKGKNTHADPSILGGAGYTLGTIDFLAPEQAQNATHVGHEADIYSLGCSIYMVLAGRVPFADGTAQEKMRAHRLNEPESLLKVKPNVPEAIARLVDWMMKKRPEDRPQSMEQVARELERFAEPALPEPENNNPIQREIETIQLAEARWQSLRGAPTELQTDELIPIEPSAIPVPRIKKKTTRKQEEPQPEFPWLWVGIGLAIAALLFGGCLILAIIGWLIAR